MLILFKESISKSATMTSQRRRRTRRRRPLAWIVFKTMVVFAMLLLLLRQGQAQGTEDDDGNDGNQNQLLPSAVPPLRSPAPELPDVKINRQFFPAEELEKFFFDLDDDDDEPLRESDETMIVLEQQGYADDERDHESDNEAEELGRSAEDGSTNNGGDPQDERLASDDSSEETATSSPDAVSSDHRLVEEEESDAQEHNDVPIVEEAELVTDTTTTEPTTQPSSMDELLVLQQPSPDLSAQDAAHERRRRSEDAIPSDEVKSESEQQPYDAPMVDDVQPDTTTTRPTTTNATSTAMEPDLIQYSVPQPPNKEQYEEPVVDAATVIADRSDEQRPAEEPDMKTEEKTVNVGAIIREEKLEEPVVDAARVEPVVETESSDEHSPAQEPEERKLNESKAAMIPQPPNEEQYEEPSVVNAASAEQSEDLDKQQQQQPPVEEPNPTMTDAEKMTAPEPPTPFQQIDVDDESLFIAQVFTEETSIPAGDHVGETSLPDTESDELKPVAELAAVDTVAEQPDADAKAPPPEEELGAAMGSNKRTDREPPTPADAGAILVNEDDASSNNTFAVTTESPPTPTDVPDIAKEDRESEDAPKAPKKGSLAEFFQKANAQDKEKRIRTKKPLQDSKMSAGDDTEADGTVVQPTEAESEETPVGGEKLEASTRRGINASEQSKGTTKMGFVDAPFSTPYCTVWGDYNFARRRPADLAILYQLFRDVVDDSNVKIVDNKFGRMEAVFEKPFVKEHVDVEQAKTYYGDRRDEIAAENSADGTKSANNEFVAGLDDIDKLFEGIDPPDELDVGADGTSIQEVLMGSATRVLIKRVSVGAGFIKNKIVRAKDYVVKNTRRAGGRFKPLQKLRNKNGEFAPLHRLRDNEGAFAPFQTFRDEKGKVILPSKGQLLSAAKWIQTTSMDLYHKTETFLDKLFEGGEAEDLDFKFISESGSGNREKPIIDEEMATLLQRRQARMSDNPDRIAS